MCNNRDIAKLEARVQAYRATQYRALQAQYAAKRECEIQVAKIILSQQDTIPLSSLMRVREPYVAIGFNLKHGNQTIEAIGIARCQGRDKWNQRTGEKVALIKAVRHAARQLAGLDQLAAA